MRISLGLLGYSSSRIYKRYKQKTLKHRKQLFEYGFEKTKAVVHRSSAQTFFGSFATFLQNTCEKVL